MENKNLTLGSLFDGSGGFPLGGLISGITPLWASEIEPFPIRVTTKRLPQVEHYGDVSTLDGAKLPPVDIITFGSPCQDMSIAGKREGLGGSRSNLLYQAVRIVKEMRCKTDGRYPRFVVWENVPGAFSSNKGKDFRAVLEEICKVKDPCVYVPGSAKWQNAGEILGNGYSIAWRVFDAQFWGVPQRRKRIYLVADFAGGCAGKILFESEGVSGYTPQGFRSWQGTSADFKEGAGTAGRICLNDQGGNRMDVTEDVTCTLRAESHHPPCVMESAGFCTEHSAKARGIGYEEETAPTLRAGTVPAAVALENHPADSRVKLSGDNMCQTLTSRMGTGGGNIPLIMENPKCYDVRFTSEGTKNARQNCYETETARTIDTGGNAPDSNQGGVAVVYGICSKDSNSMKSDNPYSGFYEAETARTLDGNGGNPSCNQGGMAVVALHGSMIGRKDENGPQGSGINEEVSFTLNATDHHAVAHPVYCTSKNSHHTIAEKELANTLVATDYKDPPCVAKEQTAEPHYIVRRLTPTECARLQGFPDWWCADLGTENPTDEDLEFWRGVFETHRKIMGTSSKPKTDKQIIKWLKNPHSDSAEYKMWGNGIFLGNAYFVLSGIVYYSQFPDFLL
ncbi:MAG: DNA cytosine methyltransferase [Bacteroidales bacterium]|nr:DNA cytosine methyltransferase [Bacteroidales bacterium]